MPFWRLVSSLDDGYSKGVIFAEIVLKFLPGLKGPPQGQVAFVFVMTYVSVMGRSYRDGGRNGIARTVCTSEVK